MDDALPTRSVDAKGDFSISASGFSEPSCVATLFDGSVSVEVTLSGCTAYDPRGHRPSPPSHRCSGRSQGAQLAAPFALSWQPPATAEGGELPMAGEHRNPTSGTLVLIETTSPKVTATTLSGLAVGTYYWQVQSVTFPPEPLLSVVRANGHRRDR